jgi:hypothetical protein
MGWPTSISDVCLPTAPIRRERTSRLLLGCDLGTREGSSPHTQELPAKAIASQVRTVNSIQHVRAVSWHLIYNPMLGYGFYSSTWGC